MKKFIEKQKLRVLKKMLGHPDVVVMIENKVYDVLTERMQIDSYRILMGKRRGIGKIIASEIQTLDFDELIKE